jgi:hypothetical protein
MPVLRRNRNDCSGSFSSDRPASDALGMSASLRSRPTWGAAVARAAASGHAARRAAERSKKLKPLHSITSSVRASSTGGISRPSALAALRLITNSILVGCSTGKSAGLAPLRILPAYAPDWRHASAKLAP